MGGNLFIIGHKNEQKAPELQFCRTDNLCTRFFSVWVFIALRRHKSAQKVTFQAIFHHPKTFCFERKATGCWCTLCARSQARQRGNGTGWRWGQNHCVCLCVCEYPTCLHFLWLKGQTSPLGVRDLFSSPTDSSLITSDPEARGAPHTPRTKNLVIYRCRRLKLKL